ncbi:MAG: polysaccharide biosynthesis/export family protein [Lachnospiraceae bacterium]|nr:polysaccharide biosynthesis/export family protein [Lachnospiraceae bacterium]
MKIKAVSLSSNPPTKEVINMRIPFDDVHDVEFFEEPKMSSVHRVGEDANTIGLPIIGRIVARDKPVSAESQLITAYEAQAKRLLGCLGRV